MVKTFSKLDIEALEKEINEFTKDKEVISVHYSSQLQNSHGVVNQYGGQSNTTYVTRHFALVHYK